MELFSCRLIKLTMSKLTKWIHNYISVQECSEFHVDDMKPHVVFYSVCQAFFHLFVARHKEFLGLKNGEFTFTIRTYILYI